MSIWNRRYRWLWQGTATLMLASSTVWAQEDSDLAPIEDAPGFESAFSDALSSDTDFEYRLANLQPPATTDTPTPTATRRRRQTYQLPPMFGDNFGGGSYQATLQLPAVVIQQMLVDGQGGVNFRVVNRNGGAGADPNPTVVIDVLNNFDGTRIASSIGPGTPPGQPSSYPIGEPQLAGVSPPVVGPGTLVYGGGTADYAGAALPVGDAENWNLNFSHIFTPAAVLVNIPAGGAVGREKIAENNSPQPRSRFFWNYNYYNNVLGGINDVNRNSFGFEQPLSGGTYSVAMRFPFASTLDSDQVVNAPVARATQFGDIAIIGKALLWENDDFLASAGLGLTLPTADNSRVFDANGAQIMELDHRSVRLMPYLGAMQGYESGWYWQSFVQLDIAANGDSLAVDMTGTNLQQIGVLQEPTVLFVDFGAGRWIMGSPGSGSPAVAATAELHYATTLQDADAINAAGVVITNTINRYDVLNLTLGLNIALSDRIQIRPAFVTPLNDDLFDSEAMLQANFWR